MTNVWQQLPKPFFVLAPMEAVTDVVFRHVVSAAARPDLYMTEFTNAASFCSPKGVASTRGRLTFTPDEQPIVAQIWGTKPENFAEMSVALKEMGFTGIDINMGCPDKAVVKGGGGIGLFHTPELAAKLIKSARAGGLPVSVKTRIGDTKVEQWRDWIGHLLRQDLPNLTVHLRTRKEMSKVPAHYELIPEILKLRDEIAPQTLITINGDIKDRAHGQELIDKYGVDGVMIGRGIFTNPFAFEVSAAEHSQAELIDLLKLHLDLHDKYSAKLEPRNFDPLKRFFKIYIHSFPGASELRQKLMLTKSSDEVRQIIESL